MAEVNECARISPRTYGQAQGVETPVASPAKDHESEASGSSRWSSSTNPVDPTDATARQTILVDFMAKLEPLEPSQLVRGVRAFHVLKGFGKILRGGRPCDYDKLYGLGRPVESIDEFWSHSWQGSPLAKIWLFLMLKNGMAALCIGSCMALIMALLSFMRYLPGYNKEPLYDEPTFTGEYHFAPWANLAGNLAALATLLLWRPKGQIFLDRVCIHQGDPALNAKGLLSLGAFLKQSKVLIVACDNIYWTRAWCVFEVAAFLKSHGGSAKIAIRPTAMAGATFCMLGYSSLPLVEIMVPAGDILLFLRLLYLLQFGLMGYIILLYWCKFFETEEQIRNFRWEDAKCTCCEQNHVNLDGGRWDCDKDMLGGCISTWFGSIENFEEMVRTEVLSMYQRQVGRSPMGYGWLVAVNTYIWWSQLDYAASYGIEGPRLSLVPIVVAIALHLWVQPAQYCLQFAMCRWYEKQSNTQTHRKILVSVILAGVLIGNAAIPQLYNWGLLQIFPKVDPILRRIIYGISTLPFCIFAIKFLGRGWRAPTVNVE